LRFDRVVLRAGFVVFAAFFGREAFALEAGAAVDVAGAEAECCASGACASTKAATHNDAMHNHAKREILLRWTTTVF